MYFQNQSLKALLSKLKISTNSLKDYIANKITESKGYALQIGSDGLLDLIKEKKISMKKLICLEQNEKTYLKLKKDFPELKIFYSKFTNILEEIPAKYKKKIAVIIAATSLINMDSIQREVMIQTALDSLAQGGQLIYYTYSPISFVPYQQLNLHQEYCATVWNFALPVQIFSYTKNTIVKNAITKNAITKNEMQRVCA